MWNDRKPWWVKKAKDNAVDKTHWKNWCVVKVAEFRQSQYSWGHSIVSYYKPCAKLNAPQYYDYETGTVEKPIAVDNLTKQEAYEVAKGLNFLDGETNDK